MENIGKTQELLPKHSQFLKKIPPVLTIFLSFLLVIMIGSVLLVLPFASSDSANSLNYIDALFLAVSAVCVTGLSPVASVGVTLSLFGRTVLGLLIQIGGLGLVTIVAFVIVMTGKRMNMATASVVKESLNQTGYKELKKLLVHIVIITAVFETVGTGINLIVFSQDYPLDQAFGISLFHAVSSFNNAGFDIIGSTSLAGYSDNVLLNLNTCFLIICGGIGFLVYEDIFHNKTWRHLSIQTKVVLLMNGGILLFSFLLIKLLQWDSITWLQAFFYAVNLRTAGFATFDVGAVLKVSTAVLSMALMFVGGSPMSTAGGVKTTTAYVISRSIISSATGRKPIAWKREIYDKTTNRAFILFTISILDVFAATVLISAIEGDNVTLLESLYECFSAFGTVGNSMGITTRISWGSKIVLCLLMYFGRLGPVTILNLWTPLLKNKGGEVEYLSTDIMIG